MDHHVTSLVTAAIWPDNAVLMRTLGLAGGRVTSPPEVMASFIAENEQQFN